MTGRLALLDSAERGVLDELTCPNCHRRAVSVWFSHPSEDEYRTWFLCSNCSFQMRAQNTSRPNFYSDGRIKALLNEHDRKILERIDRNQEK
jgi:protein-arginine kinase activator protein McsA